MPRVLDGIEKVVVVADMYSNDLPSVRFGACGKHATLSPGQVSLPYGLSFRLDDATCIIEGWRDAGRSKPGVTVQADTIHGGVGNNTYRGDHVDFRGATFPPGQHVTGKSVNVHHGSGGKATTVNQSYAQAEGAVIRTTSDGDDSVILISPSVKLEVNGISVDHHPR